MSYGQVVEHISMALDDHRNSYYEKALDKVVQPGSVVMDLGAGIGILGFIALAKGAERVIMVEPAIAIHGARKVARALGVEDRVQFVESAIEDFHDPVKVDCIVSVFTGNFLLEEDLLPSLFYARDHFLKPGGALLPDRACMQITPVSAPEYYERQIDRWLLPSSGVDFSSLRSFAVNTAHHVVFGAPDSVLLSPPAELHEIDFTSATRADCRATVQIDITTSGLCHGLLGSFKTRIGDDWLSTEPGAERTHWSQLLLPLNEPLDLKAGEQIDVSIDRPEFGEWTWTVEYQGRVQRHSTFLSNPAVPSALARRSENFQPQLSQEGEAIRSLLDKFDGQTTRGELEADLRKELQLTDGKSSRLLDDLVSLCAKG